MHLHALLPLASHQALLVSKQLDLVKMLWGQWESMGATHATSEATWCVSQGICQDPQVRVEKEVKERKRAMATGLRAGFLC